MLLVTFLATLGLGIEQGIAVGVILSLVMVIYRTTRPHLAVLGKVPGTTYYRNVDRFDEVEPRKDLLIVRFDAQLYFANTNFFKDKLEELSQVKKDTLRAVIIVAESMNQIDSSAIHALHEVLDDFKRQNVKVLFAGVKGPVRDAMARAHLTEEIGKEHFFMSIQDAVDYFDGEYGSMVARERGDYVLQTND
jgi:SulP family sulfate permease